jgi:amino acid transporter
MGTTMTTPGTTLEREAVGLREVVFQSITHMAPAIAVAFSVSFAFTFAGGSTPLAVVLALVGCFFCALSIGQLAKHLPSAGSFYTYTSRGIHPSIGFLVAWAYALAEPLVAPILYLQLGFIMQDVMAAEFGWPADLWWPWALGAALIVFALGYFGIKVSTRTGTVLGVFEVGVFAVLAIWLIAQADNITFNVFGTDFANNPDFGGFQGVFAGSVYTILAFIGFEAAAPLAEEAKDPRRTIPRAVVLSCVVIGLFYVLCAFGAAMFFGPAELAGFTPGTGWLDFGRAVWGAGWVLVLLALVNSAIANSNSGSNAATRTLFAMGRIRVLPGMLAQVHPRYRSPHVAVWVQLVVGVVATLWLGFQYDPVTASFIIATLLVVALVAIYIVVNVACMLFYLRERRDEFNPILHLVVPVLGILAFIPGFAAGAGLRIFDFIFPLTWPLSAAGIAVGIWMAIGIAYLVYLYSTNRQRIQDTAKVFIDEEPEVVVVGGADVERIPR